MGEDFRVHADVQELAFAYNDIHLPAFNADVLRIIMLYVGQSAALDHYEVVVDRLLAEAGKFAQELERYGRLKTSRRNVQRFIGRTLAVRNRLVDNLYIMDAPDITWENEYLDKVDRGMKKTFDIAERFRSLDYQLRENTREPGAVRRTAPVPPEQHAGVDHHRTHRLRNPAAIPLRKAQSPTWQECAIRNAPFRPGEAPQASMSWVFSHECRSRMARCRTSRSLKA